jgi:hypothetical protein
MQLEAAKSEIEQKTKENDTLHNQLNELRFFNSKIQIKILTLLEKIIVHF